MKSLLYLAMVLALSGSLMAANTINVPAGGDFQSALNSALPGDTIVLATGATYTGNFVLPAKSGTGTITIRSSASASLPPDGTRIQPSDAQYMAKVVTLSNASVLTAETRSHGYRITGLEITNTGSPIQADDLVRLGAYETSAADLPSDYLLDHIYIHGSAAGVKHGLVLNGARIQIRDSEISNIASADEAHAIVGWNGTGPYQILNNRLEGTGHAILFGGANSLANVVASDVEIRGNYLHKPISFNNPNYLVKHLLELKKARRVTIAGNIMENDWQGGQWCLVITVYPDGNVGSDVTDVSITGNRFRNCSRGIDISGTQAPVARITFQGNLLYDIPGTMMLLMGPMDTVNVDRNTMVTAPQADMVLSFDNQPVTNVSVTNNIMYNGTYGVKGSGTGVGTATLNAWAPGAIFTGNVMVGADPSIYPAGNFFPATLSLTGYKLPVGSPYTAGPDIGALNATLANVIVGLPAAGGTTLSCDLNSDGAVNVLDVQLATNQTLGYATCGSAALTGDGTCSVIDIQRIISASLGAACHLGP